jgi:hypothetical protein
MGFHAAWKYRKVHELIFEAGRLISAADLSDKMTEFRKDVDEAEKRSDTVTPSESLMRWIERCFSRNYKLWHQQIAVFFSRERAVAKESRQNLH